MNFRYVLFGLVILGLVILAYEFWESKNRSRKIGTINPIPAPDGGAQDLAEWFIAQVNTTLLENGR